MQKRILIAGALVVSVLFTLGCKESVINSLKIPQATLGAPVLSNGLSAITSTDSASITATFTHVNTNTLADGTGSSTTPPSGLKVVRTGNAVCSAVNLSAVTDTGALIAVSGCGGTGNITVQINADVLSSTTSLSNKASATVLIRVDNTLPTATLAVTSAAVGTTDGANTVTATFSEAVKSLSTTNSNGEFTVSGCTTTQPSVAITSTLNGAGRTVATAVLSAGDCDDNDTVTVELNMDKITDLAGNDGDAADNVQISYDVTSQPVATLAAVTYPGSQTSLGASGIATSGLSFVNTVSTTLTAASGDTATPPAGISATPTGTADCTIDVLSPSITGASIRLSACSGEGTIAIQADAGIATSGTAAQNVASNTRSFVIDAVTPTVALAVTNAYAGTAAGLNTVTATFDELIQNLPANNSNSVFTVSGCSVNPAVTIVMSVNGSGHSVATGTLSGGTCADLATVTVSLDLTQVTDTAGNVGSASDNPTPVTYEIDLSSPVASLAAPDYGGGSFADLITPAVVDLTWSNTASTTLSNGTGDTNAPPAGITITGVTGDAACTVDVTSSTTSGATITLSACSGTGTVSLRVDASLASSPWGHQNDASTAVVVDVSN
ncbi:hypothetical protein D3C87_377330 [compost metagenome]